jgi:hypothetical protein
MTETAAATVTDVEIRLSELYFPDDETIQDGHTTQADGSPFISTSADAIDFAQELETTAAWMRLLAGEGFSPFEYEGIGMRTDRAFASMDELRTFLRGLGGPLAPGNGFPTISISCQVGDDRTFEHLTSE